MPPADSPGTMTSSRFICAGHHATDSLQTIDLRGQHEVAPRETVDLVRPDLDAHLSPGELDVRVVPFPFGDRTDAVGKGEGGGEVGERIVAGEVVAVDDAPRGIELRPQ